MRSIAWDQDVDFEEEKAPTLIATDDVRNDDSIYTNKQEPNFSAEKPIQKEEKRVEKTHKTQIVEGGQSSLVLEKENVELLPQMFELKNQKTMASVMAIESDIPKIQSPEFYIPIILPP